jgi:hypothetical protein
MGKITDEELQKIEQIRNQALEIASVLGELNYQKIIIEDQIDQQKQAVKTVKNIETEFFGELRQKYGNVSINIQTGEFN